MEVSSGPWYANLLAARKDNILTVGEWSCELAPPEIVEMFFTTAARIGKPPHAQKAPFTGFLPLELATLCHLDEVEQKLRAAPAEDVVWNPVYRVEDYKNAIDRYARSAAGYFRDAKGRPLIAAFQEGVRISRETGQPMRMTCPGQIAQYLKAGFLLVIVGFACMAFLFWLIPYWDLGSVVPDPRYNRGRGFPVWTLPAGLFGMGAGLVVLAGWGVAVPTVFRQGGLTAVILVAGIVMSFALAVSFAWLFY